MCCSRCEMTNDDETRDSRGTRNDEARGKTRETRERKDKPMTRVVLPFDTSSNAFYKEGIKKYLGE